MTRPLTLALLVAVCAALATTPARADSWPVYVLPSLDLNAVAGDGAVGYLVPGAGPETSTASAWEALRSGVVRNSLLPPAERTAPTEPTPLVRAAAPPAHGPAILVVLPAGGEQPNDRRYPVAVIGPGYGGLLTSDSTRIPGLVSIADVRPTALRLDGALGSKPSGDPLRTLERLDARIAANGEARLAASLLAAAVVLVLAYIWPRAALAGFATLLAGNLALGALAWTSPIAIAAAVAAATAAGFVVALLLRGPVALGTGLVAVLAAYLVALALDPTVVSLSPLGPSQSGRFYGISNLLETLLLVPALAAAALLKPRLGWPAFGAVGALALVLVGASRFGADGGGAVVVAAGFAVLAALVGGLRGRSLALAAGAALLAVGGLLLADAVAGPASHVTGAVGEGPGGLAEDVGRRLELSYRRVTADQGAAAVALVSLAGLAALAARARGRPVLVALLAALAVSLLVNDSPSDVLAVGLAGCLAVRMCTLAPRCAASRPPSYSASSSPS